MFKRLKRALVESYIGAIALGYLLAQAVVYFVGIFSAPVASWVAQKRTAEFINRSSGSTGPLLSTALPQLIDCVLLLALWYILLRWLYLERPKKEPSATITGHEQSA